MRIRDYPPLPIIIGMLCGISFFLIDTYSERLFSPDSSGQFLVEIVEFIFFGPGVGLAVGLLVAHFRQEKAAAIKHERAERLQWLGHLTAMMAHEIRNPLHNSNLIIQTQRQDLPAYKDHELSRELERNMGRINTAVKLMYRLAAPESLQLSVTDLRNVISRLQQEWPDLQFPMIPLVKVQADSELLEILLSNLLRNAYEACQHSHQVSIDVHNDGSSLMWTITNPGVLPPELSSDKGSYDLIRAFSTLKPGHLGVGLSIAAHLAKVFQGNLTLHQKHNLVITRLKLNLAS